MYKTIDDHDQLREFQLQNETDHAVILWHQILPIVMFKTRYLLCKKNVTGLIYFKYLRINPGFNFAKGLKCVSLYIPALYINCTRHNIMNV